jgi:predicted dehydrogenase
VSGVHSGARGDATPVALVGCGRWGRHILRDLVELCCAVVVADRDGHARAHARSAGAVAAVGDAAELPDVAGAVVATPTSTHAAVLDRLLPRDVPIFCEKPLTADAASAAELAARGGTRLFVMDKWRYHSGIEALRDLARSGELGPVRGVRSTRTGWANPHGDVDAVWVLAPHDLSIAIEILGRLPEPRAAVGEQINGRVVGLLGLLGGDPWVVLDVSVATAEKRREVRLYCRDGLAVLPDAYCAHVQILRPGAPAEHRAIASELPLRRELHAFLTHLAGGPPPKSGVADGVAVVSTLTRLRALAGFDTGGGCGG